MNWKNVIAVVLTVVIAATLFCMARAEVSDNLEYIIETMEADYTVNHKTCDAPTQDCCIFLTDGLLISTIDAYSKTQYVWQFQDPVVFYTTAIALMAGQQSDCIFALNSTDFVAMTGDAIPMMNMAASLSLMQVVEVTE